MPTKTRRDSVLKKVEPYVVYASTGFFLTCLHVIEPLWIYGKTLDQVLGINLLGGGILLLIASVLCYFRVQQADKIVWIFLIIVWIEHALRCLDPLFGLLDKPDFPHLFFLPWMIAGIASLAICTYTAARDITLKGAQVPWGAMVLYLVTALSTGWVCVSAYMWAIWGAPIDPYNIVAIIGSLGLLFASWTTLFGGRLGHGLASLSTLPVMFYFVQNVVTLFIDPRRKVSYPGGVLHAFLNSPMTYILASLFTLLLFSAYVSVTQYLKLSRDRPA
jgi:hypothetical protein